ncbi:MAG: hypothetical protein AAFZ11_03740 [Pseudomonadota bacterium]
MQRIIGSALIGALAGLVAACSPEAETPETIAAPEQGGEVKGEVLGGSVSDAMIPLESLKSQSPSLRRQTTTTTVTQSADGGETTVQTTTVTQSESAGEAPAPSPPVPPATPGE